MGYETVKLKGNLSLQEEVDSGGIAMLASGATVLGEAPNREPKGQVCKWVVGNFYEDK